MSIRRLTLTGLATLIALGAGAIFAGAAALAAAPTFDFTVARVTTVNARLSVFFDPQGQAAECQFQYVEDSGYDATEPDPYEAGRTMPCAPVESGVREQEILVAEVTDLSPATQYHYRFILTNASGTTDVPDSTFETPPLRPAVIESESGEPFAYSGAMLGAEVNPEYSNTNYYFQYGTTTAYSSGTAPATPNTIEGAGFNYYSGSVSVELNGLAGGTTYHYRLVTTNPGGTTYGEDETFTTPPPSPAVETGAPSAITQTSASVTGTVNPETLATNYYYQYGPTIEYGQTTAATEVGAGSSPVPAPAVLFPLAPGLTYHYRLVAVNEDGTSYGQDQTVTTAAGEAPAISAGSASNVSVNGASISGTLDPRGSLTSYRFEYGTTTAYGTQTFGTANPSQGEQTVTLSLQGLQPATTYHYRLVASNPAGTAVGGDATFTTPPIASPLTIPGVAPLIANPNIAFPRTAGMSPTSPKALTRAQKLTKALKACKKDKSKAKRAKCDATAHKDYGPVKKSKKKK